MQKHIITIGEALLDIVFKDGRPVGATPGGSMLNTSLSLGRLGIPVVFVTELAADRPGEMIMRFLRENGVDTSFVTTLQSGQTPIALAFLDENRDAVYEFYKSYPLRRLTGPLPQARQGDVLLFGSFFALDPALRTTLVPFVESFRKVGLTVYDPNFRKAHLSKMPRLKAFIMENIDRADIVKGSNEDFSLIFGTEDPRELFRLFRQRGCSVLVMTQGQHDVMLAADGIELSIPVPPIQPINTIGAGDAFSAGLLYALSRLDIDPSGLSHLPLDQWTTILETAVSFSAEVCLSPENVIGRNFAAGIARKYGGTP
jgi:fructokinase